MKTYKTWEVIKMLSENNELEFESARSIVKLFVDKDGYLSGKFGDKEGITNNVRLDSEWELRQKPVDFITAINSGKKIKGEKYISDQYIDIEQVIFELNRRTDIGILEAINGKWFIMEGE